MILGENISKVYNNGKEIQKVYSYGKLVWEYKNSEDIDYSTIPFTITAVADDVRVSLKAGVSFSFKYKKNNSEWLSCNTGEYIYLKKDDALYISALPPSNSEVSGVYISGLSDVSGNIFSLCYGDDFVGKTELQKDSIFSGFFSGCDIRNAKNLILPATNLTNYCYEMMFHNCTNLITAPSLPATTLVYFCYRSMFKGCTSLTQAPELPATSLAPYCYSSMFFGCTSLTQAPSLPSTKLADRCYSSMFEGCTNLTTAPSLPSTKLADRCYSSMFFGCTSLTQAPSLPATTLEINCYSHMFYGCTNLTTAPELPADTLTKDCYSYMFYGCTSLTQAPSLPATTLEINCYSYMFYGCSKLNFIKALFITTPSVMNVWDWVAGVSPTGTFVKNKNATWDVVGSNGIPEGWTVEYI